MAEHHRMFVDGEWIEASDGGAFAVSDPATGEVIAEVADGGPREAARAVTMFRKAALAEAVTVDLIARTRSALLRVGERPGRRPR